jgi:signal transduction histidine kinase
MHASTLEREDVGRLSTARFHPRGWRIAISRREIAAAVAVAVLYVVVEASHWVILSRAVHATGTDGAMLRVTVLEAVCWLVFTPVIFWLVKRVRWTLRGPARTAVLFAAGLPLALGISYLGLRLRWSMLIFPRGVDLREAAAFALWLGFLSAAGVYAGIVAAAIGRDYVRSAQAQRVRAARVEAQLAQTQLDALRRQLDPHFLFNTLNLISALAEDDPRAVRRMISRLGELLRFSLERAQVPEITLREELALLDQYLDIMRMRFQGRLEIVVDVDDRTLAALVPSLVLQPLVENAIRHGVEKSRGPGRLEVETALDGETIVLRVRDNGPGGAPLSAASTNGVGIGLGNTVARLEQLYGGAARFTLGPDPHGGTVAEVRVPYRSDSELRVIGIAITAVNE